MTAVSVYYPPLGLLERRNLTVFCSEVKTVFLEHITFVSIYKRKRNFQKFFKPLFGDKYTFVIFLKNDKQIEFSFTEEKLALALELKEEIIKRKLKLSA
ncbi:hypothetical protein IVB69_11960 [Flavobacterium sp. J49]|uniref:hypothetical protein n=1 Tax=Flavobacterium sp. J49 TaxID=2718534 RepID=UPI001593ECB2|nr:hypothetical protein [Flavobacterium sp. J49]MBF6642199.1 hypothetical protein [Flavobacterium sp. J49]NIC03446.1 hypothetical protein [Flavobacterium sp. J49]